MADITLINFNMLYVRYLDGNSERQCHLPLGPLYLVSALKSKDINVDFRDYQLVKENELFNPNIFLNIFSNPAKIIGISCMANLLPFILFLLPLVKRKYPDRIILLGGVGPFFIEKQILKRFDCIDIIHRGEGDISVPMLIKALKYNEPITNIPSIFYRENNKIICNPTIPRITNLDSIHRPYYYDLNFSEYLGHNILGSRGCPYPCTFCSITPIWELKAYTRSNENIINEMVYMYDKFGVSCFLFQDEYFISSPDKTKDFCNRLIKSGINVYFKAFARVDLVNKDSLIALAKAGCAELRFGIESGSDRILKKIKKGITSELSLKTLILANKYIPAVDAFYIWGFPFETMQDFSETVLQMVSVRNNKINCLPSLLTYLPQTALYRSIKNINDLEFCTYLMPEYMITGIEKRISVRVNIDKEYFELFDFIKVNKDIFPGYFHINIEKNILPKLEILEDFEFYSLEKEVCGAHSPEINSK